jgi:retinol dehydrogenase-12
MTHSPASLIEDLKDRTVLVTGANSGIGRVTALALAGRGAKVFLACRSQARTQPVLAEINASAAPEAQAEWLPLDLADLASVHACAAAFLARGLPLHLLINNAGQGGRRGLSASGCELAFGGNHLGHFLLTLLLLERLQASAPARVVTVASALHTRAKGLDFSALRQPTRSMTGLPEYAASKLANVLFSAELGRRLAGSGVSSYSLHPGMVDTDVWRRLPRSLRPLMRAVLRRFYGFLTPEEGALTTLHCATAPALAGQSGGYYSRCQRATPSAAAQDEALARALWHYSEQWAGARFCGAV